MENYLDRERYRTNRANDLQSMLSLSHSRTGAPSVLDAPGGNAPSEASEQRKKKRQERKAKIAAAKVAAAPAPTPKGKGKGKGPGKDKKVCYFNQPSGCPKTAEECWFLHKKLPAADVAKMVQPPSRAASRANSPAGGRPGPKAKASPKANATGGKNPSYCFKFAKPGGCNDSNCAFMHLDEATIKEFERAGKVLRDNATARP